MQKRTRSFVLLKPDAFQREKRDYIEYTMREMGIEIINKSKIKLEREKIFDLWKDSPIISYVLDNLCEYLLDYELELIVVESDDVYHKLPQLKKKVRKKFECEKSIYNILHVPDDAASSKREINLLTV